jgi:hypothetical protein
MIARKSVRLGLAAAAIALPVTFLASPGEASDLGGPLCRTNSPTPVFRTSDGRHIYTIPAGHDMRVHRVFPDEPRFFGHGEGHTVDGRADSSHFDFCRS